MTLARCGYSQLTIAFSAFMLYFNATLLACVVYFSSQLPFGISGSFIAYFAVASALCLLGLVGSLKVRASSQLDFLKSQRPTPCFDPLPHPYLMKRTRFQRQRNESTKEFTKISYIFYLRHVVLLW